MQSRTWLSPEVIVNYRNAFDQRARARLQANEKQRQQARQAVREAIYTVAPRYPTVWRVYLFGSVIRPGAFGADSDVDVGIEGANMALCFDIWRDLEQAVSEWNLDVRSLDNQDAFARRIRQKGELVYERSVTNP